MSKQAKIREIVTIILENSEAARNSAKDRELIIQYFEQNVCQTAEEWYFIRMLIERCPIAIDWLIRERRYIQNTQNLHKSTKQMQKLREKEE